MRGFAIKNQQTRYHRHRTSPHKISLRILSSWTLSGCRSEYKELAWSGLWETPSRSWRRSLAGTHCSQSLYVSQAVCRRKGWGEEVLGLWIGTICLLILHLTQAWHIPVHDRTNKIDIIRIGGIKYKIWGVECTHSSGSGFSSCIIREVISALLSRSLKSSGRSTPDD